MNTIEKIYTNYDGLLEEFSEEVIQSRYAVFYEEIEQNNVRKDKRNFSRTAQL